MNEERIYRTKTGEIGIHKSTFGVYMNGNADVNFWVKNGFTKCSKLYDLELLTIDQLSESELEEYSIIKLKKAY